MKIDSGMKNCVAKCSFGSGNGSSENQEVIFFLSSLRLSASSWPDFFTGYVTAAFVVLDASLCLYRRA
jgi:hypothetical protein